MWSFWNLSLRIPRGFHSPAPVGVPIRLRRSRVHERATMASRCAALSHSRRSVFGFSFVLGRVFTTINGSGLGHLVRSAKREQFQALRPGEKNPLPLSPTTPSASSTPRLNYKNIPHLAVFNRSKSSTFLSGSFDRSSSCWFRDLIPSGVFGLTLESLMIFDAVIQYTYFPGGTYLFRVLSARLSVCFSSH